MQTLLISPRIQAKLRWKHRVTVDEIRECFFNHEGNCLRDDREEHRTDPPTWWFIAPTDHSRLLKIVFVLKDGNIHIKSAFEPGKKDLNLYHAFNT